MKEEKDCGASGETAGSEMQDGGSLVIGSQSAASRKYAKKQGVCVGFIMGFCCVVSDINTMLHSCLTFPIKSLHHSAQ